MENAQMFSCYQPEQLMVGIVGERTAQLFLEHLEIYTLPCEQVISSAWHFSQKNVLRIKEITRT